MGWQSEDGSHEGYLVGLVPDEEQGLFAGHVPGRWRELSGRDLVETPLRHVKVACSCGWRSPLLWAPNGTRFVPSMVVASEIWRDACQRLWTRHVQVSGKASSGGYAVAQLLVLQHHEETLEEYQSALQEMRKTLDRLQELKREVESFLAERLKK